MLSDKLNQICEFGDILLFTYKPQLNRYSMLGYIGQKILGERYGHGAIYVGNNSIFEADSRKGVTYSNLDWVPYGTKVTILRSTDTLTMLDKSSMLQNMSNTLGKGYDKTAIVYLGLMNLLCKLRLVNQDWKTKPNPEDDPQKFFCFQLIDYVCRDFYSKVDPGNVTGEDIFKSWKYRTVYEVEV